MPNESLHLKKGLFNIQNIDDNKCFKQCLVKYLHPSDHNPRTNKKADKDLQKNLILKTENSIAISVIGYGNKGKHPIL